MSVILHISHQRELQMCEEIFLDFNVDRLKIKLENLYNLALTFQDMNIAFLKQLYIFLKSELSFVNELYLQERERNLDLQIFDINLSFSDLLYKIDERFACPAILRIKHTLNFLNIIIDELTTCISINWYFGLTSYRIITL